MTKGPLSRKRSDGLGTRSGVPCGPGGLRGEGLALGRVFGRTDNLAEEDGSMSKADRENTRFDLEQLRSVTITRRTLVKTTSAAAAALAIPSVMRPGIR